MTIRGAGLEFRVPSEQSSVVDDLPLPPSGIDPSELEVTLRVLAELSQVDQTHPDFIAVRRATAASTRDP